LLIVIPEGITISNHNVKIAETSLQAHKVNGRYSGDSNFSLVQIQQMMTITAQIIGLAM
jgi:hypothetical protein